MKITIAHHIFKSIKGYQTQFRSPAVTDSENAELESFSFGQTNDADYMASLIDHPAFIVRKLSSRRWAITRVFQGPDDEYGRATLLFHTVLMNQKDWIDHLECDVQPILEHPKLWQNTELTAISVELDKSPLPTDIEEQVHSLLDKITASTSPVVVDESVCSLQIVRWVNRLLLDEEKEAFSYGYRVLSDAMNASLLCLAKQALRTQSPSKVPMLTDVRKNQSDYEPGMPYETHSGTNKVAILIVIAVCILGIAGAIFAFLSLRNAQNKKLIAKVKESAELFLDENKQFIKDTSLRKEETQKVKRIIKEIKSIQSKNSVSELEPILEKLEKWEKETTQTGKSYSQLEKLKSRLEKQQLEEVSAYPNKGKIDRVISIRNDFVEYHGNILKEFPSPQFFENFDDEFTTPILESKNKIDSWKNRIGKLIAIDPNKVENIENTFNTTDLNQYMPPDPNKVDFSDTSQLAWADPTRFMDWANEKIKLLDRLKQEIDSLPKNRYWSHAKNSPIDDHEKCAVKLSKDIAHWRDMTSKNIKDYQSLVRQVKTIKNLEERLKSDSQDSIKKFISVLLQYENKIKAKPFGFEKVWLGHYKTVILDYYKSNVQRQVEEEFERNKYLPHQLVAPEGKLMPLVDAIGQSSLKDEPLLKSVVDRYRVAQKGIEKSEVGP